MNKHAIPHVNDMSDGRFDWFREHCNYFVLCEEQDKIMGFMVVLPPGLGYPSPNYAYFNEHYDDFDYVDRIVVAEPHRRKGIGSLLYHYLMAQSNAAMITCEVNLKPENPTSILFHEQLGFYEVDQQETEGGSKLVSLRVRRLS